MTLTNRSSRIYVTEIGDPEGLVPFDSDWVLIHHEEMLNILTIFCLRGNKYEPYHLVKRDGIWKAVPENNTLPISTLDANKFFIKSSALKTLKQRTRDADCRQELSRMHSARRVGWDIPVTPPSPQASATHKTSDQRRQKVEDEIIRQRNNITKIFLNLVISHHQAPSPASLECEMRVHDNGCVLMINTQHNAHHATKGVLATLITDFTRATEAITKTGRIKGSKVTGYTGLDYHRVTWSVSSAFMHTNPTDPCVQALTPLLSDIHTDVKRIRPWHHLDNRSISGLKAALIPYGVPECVVLKFTMPRPDKGNWAVYIATRKFS